jgi:hypothetical protein
MTRDGRYWSKNTFQLPASIGASPVALEYPSAHQKFLTQQQFGGLAVLGTPRECTDTDMNTVFPAGMNDGGDAEPVVNIFVNSGRSDTYLSVKNDAGMRRPARCQKIQEGRRTGYDTICRIQLNKLAAAADTLDIKIVRRRYERMLPATEFTLQLPGLD